MILEGAGGARFAPEVTFGKLLILRTKDAVARTRGWLGQHGDGGHTGEGAHRFHAYGAQQALVRRNLAGLHKIMVCLYKGKFSNIAAI